MPSAQHSFVTMYEAWEEITTRVSEDDFEGLPELDEAEFVGSLVGVLVATGLEPDDAENLLACAGILDVTEQ